MRFRLFFVLILFLSVSLQASDHGIYLKTLSNVSADIEQTSAALSSAFKSAGYNVLAEHDIATPDLIREEAAEKCGYKARILLLEYEPYTKIVTSFGSKYLVAAFLKIGLYETNGGMQVAVTDPETINRIVFNDLPDEEYEKIVNETIQFKNSFVEIVHSIGDGTAVQEAMPPIRDDEDLRDASRDMFMMVGPMTFFDDEDQFPQIFSASTSNSKSGLLKLKEKLLTNLNSFTPGEDDRDYQITKNESDLKWKIIGEITAPDSSAVLLGITRPRTEALSFHIAGGPRQTDQDLCPGIDHASAYPVEVLLLADKYKVFVYTAREMFRMDMYFWDAGKMSFMKYMNMPKMLDNSIKKALLGK